MRQYAFFTNRYLSVSQAKIIVKKRVKILKKAYRKKLPIWYSAIHFKNTTIYEDC
jgi:hypothetical protein